MLVSSFSGYLLSVLFLVLLITVQRLLHRELQTVLLLITRSPKLALGIFSLLLFPGVLLHEFSHWVMAKILGVGVKRFSILPQTQKNGRLRMGFVETQATDFVRDSLIGLAPFITASIMLSFIGSKLSLFNLMQSILLNQPEQFVNLLIALPGQTDFWIWFYFAFTVSSTMLPSSSDRESWLYVLIGLAVIIGVLLLLGLGNWLVLNLVPRLNIWILSISFILGSSVLVHLILLFPLWIGRIMIAKLMGVEISRR